MDRCCTNSFFRYRSNADFSLKRLIKYCVAHFDETPYREVAADVCLRLLNKNTSKACPIGIRSSLYSSHVEQRRIRTHGKQCNHQIVVNRRQLAAYFRCRPCDVRDVGGCFDRYQLRRQRAG